MSSGCREDECSNSRYSRSHNGSTGGVGGKNPDTSEAVKDKLLLAKYKNPHLERRPAEHETDVIVFGDPILSKRLSRSLLFDKALAEKLSLDVHFSPNRTDTACIVSATRSWRELTDGDVKVLLNEIKKIEELPSAIDTFLSTDEVVDLREIDLEDFIARNPKYLGDDLKLIERQYDITPTERIDLLFEDKNGAYVVVELKLGVVGRKELNQVKGYTHQIRKAGRLVKGILVCKDISPAFENAFKSSKDIKVWFYGWRFGLQPAWWRLKEKFKELWIHNALQRNGREIQTGKNKVPFHS